MPVSDFYDFGGGFYFTLLVGRQPNGSIPITPDTGWLIGEAVVDGGTLTGTIEFYPYPGGPADSREEKVDIQVGPQSWRPSRVAR